MRRKFIVWMAFLLLLLSASKGLAQSDVLSSEDKIVFGRMDARLMGNWQGHGDGDGMRFDREAIICMADACADIKARFPSDPQQLRNSDNFTQCYAAHLARVKKPAFVRLSNPPPLASLVCELIAGQAAALRPVSQASSSKSDAVAARNVYTQAPRSHLSPEESENLYAQLENAVETRTHGQPPRSYEALGPGLELMYANGKEAAVYVKPGGQFYALQRTWLAKKYEADWEKSYLNPRNEFRDFIGACFLGRAVKLDPERMRAGNDKARLDGANDTSFIDECAAEGGEFRFALQAGQVIKLAAKDTQAQPADSRISENSGDSSSKSEVSTEPVPSSKRTNSATAAAPSVSKTASLGLSPEKKTAGTDSWFTPMGILFISVIVITAFRLLRGDGHKVIRDVAESDEPETKAVPVLAERTSLPPPRISGLDLSRPLSELRPRRRVSPRIFDVSDRWSSGGLRGRSSSPSVPPASDVPRASGSRDGPEEADDEPEENRHSRDDPDMKSG